MATTNQRTTLLRVAQERFTAAGVDATSMEDVRRRAGASTGSLYHHFPSKAHLVAAVFIEALRSYQHDFLAALSQHSTAEDGVRGMVDFHLRWCEDHEEDARMLFRERRPDSDSPGAAELRDLNRAFLGRVLDWWRPHAHYGALRDLSIAETYVLWLGPAQEMCRLWLSGRTPHPPSAAVTTLADAAWRSLATDAFLDEPPAT